MGTLAMMIAIVMMPVTVTGRGFRHWQARDGSLAQAMTVRTKPRGQKKEAAYW